MSEEIGKTCPARVLVGVRHTVSLIAARGLSVRLGGQLVLFRIDLAIDSGEIVTVIGPNGSGKSTLLRALVGAVKPSEGSIERAPGLRIGYVPQRLHLDSRLPITVNRFLRLGIQCGSDDIRRALAETGIPGLERRQMTTLSGGQFQRVLLARALLSAPDLLLLDEPAQGLDEPGVASFCLLLKQMRMQLGCGVLMVSHDLHAVMSTADRVIGLKGIIRCEGPPMVVVSSAEYHELFGDAEACALPLCFHEEGNIQQSPESC